MKRPGLWCLLWAFAFLSNTSAFIFCLNAHGFDVFTTDMAGLVGLVLIGAFAAVQMGKHISWLCLKWDIQDSNVWQIAEKKCMGWGTPDAAGNVYPFAEYTIKNLRSGTMIVVFFQDCENLEVGNIVQMKLNIPVPQEKTIHDHKGLSMDGKKEV